ncbi:MAG TPA: LytR C-terminal domain-containing protein [Spirochaetota bacterium]|nr:LytR C-terminal domain-containing protein [Spirochaetota bacterium]
MNKQFIKYGIWAGAAALALLGIVYFYRISTRNAVETLAQNKKMINVLIAGSNAYRDNKHRFFAILSINPNNARIGITFLPPNLKIFFDSGRKRSARIEDIDIDSFNKISQSLARDLKMHLHFYVELYAQDVRRTVDLIEGIDLFILDQWKDQGDARIGVNYLDGGKIIDYINSVDGNSIFRKYDRIQDVLLTLHSNRKKYKRFYNKDFAAEVIKNVRTNLLDQEILSLLKYFFEDAGLISTLVPGGLDEKGNYVIDDISYKLYESEFLGAMVLDERSDQSIKVKILNGTSVPGLAKKMRNILMKEGLTVVEFGTSPYPFFDHTIIINQGGDTGNAMRVAEILGVDRVHHIIDSSQLNSAVIIIGKDYIK